MDTTIIKHFRIISSSSKGDPFFYLMCDDFSHDPISYLHPAINFLAVVKAVHKHWEEAHDE